jgi:hypothetical protein
MRKRLKAGVREEIISQSLCEYKKIESGDLCIDELLVNVVIAILDQLY